MKLLKKNQNLLILLVLTIGLVVGLVLVRQTQIFKPKASEEAIKVVGSNVVLSPDGKTVFTSEDGNPKVNVSLTTPFDR